MPAQFLFVGNKIAITNTKEAVKPYASGEWRFIELDQLQTCLIPSNCVVVFCVHLVPSVRPEDEFMPAKRLLLHTHKACVLWLNRSRDGSLYQLPMIELSDLQNPEGLAQRIPHIVQPQIPYGRKLDKSVQNEFGRFCSLNCLLLVLLPVIIVVVPFLVPLRNQITEQANITLAVKDLVLQHNSTVIEFGETVQKLQQYDQTQEQQLKILAGEVRKQEQQSSQEQIIFKQILNQKKNSLNRKLQGVEQKLQDVEQERQEIEQDRQEIKALEQLLNQPNTKEPNTAMEMKTS